MIHVYTGDGKGKTTAAFGLAMRAAGHGLKVRVIQLMKGSTYTGELASSERIGIEVFQFGRTCPHAAVIKTGFLDCQKCRECWIGVNEISELDRKKIRIGWELAERTVREAGHDLLIIDEIMAALHKNLVTLPEIISFLQSYPAHRELVLTGRGAPPEIIQAADLVTEMKMIKHPYNEGIPARRGIEY